jgi:hypothetical protein
MSRLLYKALRSRLTKAVGSCFLCYTAYDHLCLGTVTREQQHANLRYSTVHHASQMDRTFNSLSKLPNQRSIRLIKLHGTANRDDEIYISYEALSYTWGDKLPDQAVYTGAGKFYITKNVQAIMKELRLKPGKSRYLWIDAICINQDDIVEKNSQVAMMAEIYKKATRVNIWLGESNQSSRSIFMLSRLFTLPLAPVLWIERKILYLDSPTDSRSRKTSFVCDMVHTGFLVLLFGLELFNYLPISDWPLQGLSHSLLLTVLSFLFSF